MLDLNDAVDRLAAVEPRLARVVECRFFGGLSEDETAETLGITKRTVQRDWAKARMLLLGRSRRDDSTSDHRAARRVVVARQTGGPRRRSSTPYSTCRPNSGPHCSPS